MAAHAEDSLRSPRISEVLYLALAIPTAETCCTKGLVTGKNGQILNLVPTGATAVGAIVADEGTVTQKKEIGVGVEESAASVAAKTIEVPPIAGCQVGKRQYFVLVVEKGGERGE